VSKNTNCKVPISFVKAQTAFGWRSRTCAKNGALTGLPIRCVQRTQLSQELCALSCKVASGQADRFRVASLSSALPLTMQ
jgi:hypothetical protein